MSRDGLRRVLLFVACCFVCVACYLFSCVVGSLLVACCVLFGGDLLLVVAA